jgi:phosphatidylinositol alpha-1,6-mannosyltransferase
VILFLTPGCFDKGGISRYNRYQIDALRNSFGINSVRVLSVLGPGDADFEVPFDVTWSAGGTSKRQKAKFAMRTLSEAIVGRPDAIFAAHVNLASLGHVAARLSGARSILNVYGLEVWSGLRPDAAWGLKSADMVLADCHFTADYIHREGLRGEPKPLHVLWDCVDDGRFSPAEPRQEVLLRYRVPKGDGNTIVLTLGRLTPDASHKGYDRLLEAFALAVPRAPNLQLVYAGKGQLVERLERRARELGIEAQVHFIGPVHENDLADIYRNCDIFSLVSDRGKGRGEGIPLTPLEAAACGKPILVGNHDGSQEAVEDGENGYVLDPFNIPAHAERIVELALSPTLRAKMGRAARSRAVSNHAFKVFAAKQAAFLADMGIRVTMNAKQRSP